MTILRILASIIFAAFVLVAVVVAVSSWRMHTPNPMAILFKSIFGGVVAVVLAWIVLISAMEWRTRIMRQGRFPPGLRATAGGWEMLLHTPWVAIFLAAAFGIGLFVTARNS